MISIYIKKKYFFIKNKGKAEKNNYISNKKSFLFTICSFSIKRICHKYSKYLKKKKYHKNICSKCRLVFTKYNTHKFNFVQIFYSLKKIHEISNMDIYQLREKSFSSIFNDFNDNELSMHLFDNLDDNIIEYEEEIDKKNEISSLNNNYIDTESYMTKANFLTIKFDSPNPTPLIMKKIL